MHDAPGPAELLAVAAAVLRETCVPALSGHAAFEARVAAGALDIARREIEAGAADAAAARARLAALLGREGEPEALTAELAARIAAGEMDLSTPGLADHLWRTTLDRVAVDQPGFPLLRRLREAGEA